MTKQSTYSVPYLYDNIAAKRTSAPLTVSVPGSKSITNRALLLATLADGMSTLRGALFSDDSRHFLKCIQNLGFEAQTDEAAGIIQREFIDPIRAGTFVFGECLPRPEKQEGGQ